MQFSLLSLALRMHFTTLRSKDANIFHASSCFSASIALSNLREAFRVSVNPFTCELFIRSEGWITLLTILLTYPNPAAATPSRPVVLREV